MRWLKQLKGLNNTDPSQLNNPLGPGQNSPAPGQNPQGGGGPSDPPAGSNEFLDDAAIAQLPDYAQRHIKHLRWENGKFRGEKAALKTKNEELATNLNSLTAAQREAEQKQLLENEQYKKVWENDRDHYSKEILKREKIAINAKVEAAAIAAGIPAKLIATIPLSGISITADGEISGVNQAVDKFKVDFAEFINPMAAATTPPAANGVSQAAAATQPPLQNQIVPGTQMTYAQLQSILANMGNAGAAPPPTVAPGSAGNFNATTATEAERKKRLAEINRNQGRR